MHNDAYAGASHGPDVAFCVPVFVGGELIGFAATTAHHLDIGALYAGLAAASSMRSTPMPRACSSRRSRSTTAACKNDAVWQIVRDNIRASDLVVGDMDAQIAAARIGAERMVELVERYGLRDRRPSPARTLMDSCRAADAPGDRASCPTASIAPRRRSTAISTATIRRKKELPIVVTITKKDDEPRRRPDRHRAAGARPADQHAARRHRRHRDLADHPLGAARHRRLRPHPGERRADPADHHRGAQGHAWPTRSSRRRPSPASVPATSSPTR